MNKLTDNQIIELKDLINHGLHTRKTLATMYNVSRTTLIKIKLGKARRPKKAPTDKTLTQQKLKELLTYDEITGEFRWLQRADNRNNNHVGTIAGHTYLGYRYISIFHKGYAAHKLAFLYMTGVIPKIVDHINRNSLDNRWSNLREADSINNARNKSIARNNTTGFTGLQETANNKWDVFIWEKNQPIRIGRFETFELAVEARKNAAAKYYGAFSPHLGAAI